MRFKKKFSILFIIFCVVMVSFVGCGKDKNKDKTIVDEEKGSEHIEVYENGGIQGELDSSDKESKSLELPDNINIDSDKDNVSTGEENSNNKSSRKSDYILDSKNPTLDQSVQDIDSDRHKEDMKKLDKLLDNADTVEERENIAREFLKDVEIQTTLEE